MAKTSKNILGDQRGKIGKVVGRVVEGVQMYSAAPGPRGSEASPKQKEHRAKFKAVQRLAKPLNGIVNIGLHLAASGRPLISPANIFTKRNKSLMQYDASTGIVTPDYEHLVLSDGRTPYVEFGTASFTESRTVTVPFTSPSDSDFGGFDDDTVYIAVYCPGRDECTMATAQRSETEISATVAPTWVGETVYVWWFVKTSVEEDTLVEKVGVKIHPGECSTTSYIATGVIS